MSEMMEELNRADRQRKTLQKNGYHDEWDWVDVPCKIWKVAPVDEFLPQLSTCDLATLSSYSRPVLDRYVEHLLRRYRMVKGPKQVEDVDTDWNLLNLKYSNLNLVISEHHVTKRMVNIAKARLTAK
jgi:hypothetical protein